MSASLIVSHHHESRNDLLQLVECTKLFPENHCVRNSADALNILEEQQINVIFYDWQPPELGELIELVGHINNRDEWYDIPLIVFTAQQKKDIELTALQLGASGCLGYGVSSKELAVRLYPHLSHKKRADSLRKENRQLAKLAITDRLTGLHNRSYFDLMLEFEGVRCRRKQSVISILVLAIDPFDLVVNQFGPAAGDNLLRLVADVIHGSIRQVDIACRFSHAEFAIILADTSSPDAYRLAERVRKEVFMRGPKPPLSSFQTTVSIGISGAMIESALDATRLVDEAFCAIEAGKRNGANRTEIFCHATLAKTTDGQLIDLDYPQGRA